MNQEQLNEYGRIERKITAIHETLNQDVGASTMDLIKDLVALELTLERMKRGE